MGGREEEKKEEAKQNPRRRAQTSADSHQRQQFAPSLDAITASTDRNRSSYNTKFPTPEEAVAFSFFQSDFHNQIDPNFFENKKRNYHHTGCVPKIIHPTFRYAHARILLADSKHRVPGSASRFVYFVFRYLLTERSKGGEGRDPGRFFSPRFRDWLRANLILVLVA